MTIIREYEHEAAPGLAHRLPDGERVLWQGRPQWRPLARRLFGWRFVAAYFGALILYGALTGGTVRGLAMAAVGGAACMGLIALFCWGVARTTLYTVTSGRIVMRYGLAVPRSLNLPLRLIASAGLNASAGGAGDIALTLVKRAPLGWWGLWPHVRPWSFKQPVPVLRMVPDAAEAGAILAEALRAAQPSAEIVPFVPVRQPSQPARAAA